MIAVDTNVVAYLLTPSPHTPAAIAAYRRDPVWAAPTLWRSEFRNVLVNLIRAGQMSFSQALTNFAEAEQLLAEGEYQPQVAAVIEAAVATGCSAYDCEFAAVARDLGVPLVTADRRLAAAFPDIAVTLGEFARPGKRR